MHLTLNRQIRARKQILMNANSALGLSAPPKQTTQRKMQLGGFRIELDDLDECIDRLVGLLIQQEVQTLEIPLRQGARLGYELRDVDSGGYPAQCKKRRDGKQPPGFKFHADCPSKSFLKNQAASLALIAYAVRRRRLNAHVLLCLVIFLHGQHRLFLPRQFAAIAKYRWSHGQHAENRARREKSEQ